MAEHVWSILCDNSVVDMTTRRMYLLGLSEGVGILLSEEDMAKDLERAKRENKTLLVPVTMHLISFWVRSDMNEPEEFRARLIVETPDGRRLTTAEMRIDLQSFFGTRFRLDIDGMPYTEPGLYWFLVGLILPSDEPNKERFEQVARLPLRVERTDPPTQEAP